MATAVVGWGQAPTEAGISGATYNTGNCAADNSGGLNVADNWEHTMFLSSLTAQMATAQHEANAQVYNPLDSEVVHVGSVNAQTDLVVYDQDYSSFCGYNWHPAPNGPVGLSVCVSLNGNGECEKHENRYDNSATDNYSADQRRSLACHETGHSFGLAHSGSGCMVQGGSANGLSGDDQGAINGWYDHHQLGAGQYLWPGQSVTSLNDTYRLIMQGDGNLVGYHRNAQNGGLFSPFWWTGTSGNNFAVMQGDGNFVVYRNGGGALWATGTNCGGSFLEMQSDRNIVIYGCGGARWWSGTQV